MAFKNYYGSELQVGYSGTSEGMILSPVNWAMYGECISTVVNQYNGTYNYYSGLIPLNDANGHIWIASSGQNYTFYASDGKTATGDKSNVTKEDVTINGMTYVKVTIPENSAYYRYQIGGGSLGNLTSEEIKNSFDGYAVYLEEPLNPTGNKSATGNLRPSADYKQFLQYASTINPLIGKFWYAMGDSIFQYSGGSKIYEYGFMSRIARTYNMRFENKSYGSVAWEYSNEAHTGQYDGACACKLVDNLIASGLKPDYVTLEFSGNLNGTEGDYSNTSADTTTMCGAIRYCIERLQEYLPASSAIGVIAQTQKTSITNAMYRPRQEKMMAICKDYAVPVLDMFYESGITKKMTSDGDHWSVDPKTHDYDVFYKAERVISAFLMRI